MLATAIELVHGFKDVGNTDATHAMENEVNLTVEETSAEFLGQWNRLVSSTNWEKGRIIAAWRERLRESGAPTQEWTDEAWSAQVGNVTPQHVGRLRRVYQRFSSTVDRYPGLYWSHFQAALDWDDAEMWLEGAVQNGWSVSVMRHTRWETLGSAPDQQPREADVVSAELDEDVEPTEDRPTDHPAFDTAGPSLAADAQEAEDEFEAEQGEEDDFESSASSSLDVVEPAADEARPSVRPFAELPPLPPDLTEAMEQLKLAILRHKVAGWPECPCDSVLAMLDALRQLTVAPA